MKSKPLPDLKGYGRVRVYRNLRNGKLSVMCCHSRKVIGHTDNICLTLVKFIVSKKGVERIRARKRKAVVAFAEGYPSEDNYECQTAVLFNPYQWDTFVDGHGFPLGGVDKLLIQSSGFMWAKGLTFIAPFTNVPTHGH
jgi:hypothetical protein